MSMGIFDKGTGSMSMGIVDKGTIASAPRSHAYRNNSLLKEVLEMSDKENSAYLLDFLYTHALNWATKQYSMTPRNAGKYATWYVEAFGEEWVNDVTAPPHSGWTVFKYCRSLVFGPPVPICQGA